MAGELGLLRARLMDVLSGMSSRDRALLGGLAVVTTLFVAVAVSWLAMGALSNMDEEIVTKESTLAAIVALRAEQEESASKIKGIESQLRKNARQDLPSFMEKSAQAVGIAANLQWVRERATSTEGNLEEKTYQVEVTKITVQQLVHFLHQIETDGYPLRVRSMKTKTEVQTGVKVLTVSLDISAFKLLDDAGPAEEQ